MLKRVILIAADEGQKAAVEKMRENMGDRRVDIYYMDKARALNGMQFGIRYNARNSSGAVLAEEILTLGDCAKDRILFVTDSPSALHKLQERGRYVAAWLHENNQQEDLSGAIYAVADIGELDWQSLEKIYLRLAGKPWTVMETERCVIREMTVEDVEAFYRIYAEPSITYYMENLFPEMEAEIEYTKSYIEKIYGFYGYGLWSIVCKENKEVIGRAGLSWRAGFDMPELGFVIGVPYQRKGYAYEVCRAIVTYGQEELGFERIQALVREGNRASICLCRKLGFLREDRVEDKGVWYERYVVYKK